MKEVFPNIKTHHKDDSFMRIFKFFYYLLGFNFSIIGIFFLFYGICFVLSIFFFIELKKSKCDIEVESIINLKLVIWTNIITLFVVLSFLFYCFFQILRKDKNMLKFIDFYFMLNDPYNKGRTLFYVSFILFLNLLPLSLLILSYFQFCKEENLEIFSYLIVNQGFLLVFLLLCLGFLIKKTTQQNSYGEFGEFRGKQNIL